MVHDFIVYYRSPYGQSDTVRRRSANGPTDAHLLHGYSMLFEF